MSNSLTRPSLKQLTERITNDVLARLGNIDALLVSDARVYAAVMAAVAHSLYGYIDWQAKQLFAHSADEDALILHGNFWLNEGLKQGGKASGIVTLNGVDKAVIPKRTKLRSANGLEYQTTVETVLENQKANVLCEALMPGATGNFAGKLMLTNPIGNVQSETEIAVMSGGSDPETLEEYRTRILEIQAARPLYGKSGDYAIWAKQVEGITRAWEFQSQIINRVDVYCVNDDDNPITLSPQKIVEVQQHLNEEAALADIVVMTPILEKIDFIIRLEPNDAPTQQAVVNALKDLLHREARVNGEILLSHIREVISTAAGEYDHALIFPSTDLQFNAGVLPIFGSVSWQ